MKNFFSAIPARNQKTNKKVLSVLVPYKHWTKKIQRLCEGKTTLPEKKENTQHCAK